MAKISKFVPALAWLKSYHTRDLRSDAVAGVTTAVMLIPQAMAYAMLAGLPPIVGLYASTAPLILYAIFGTSRQLAVGPVAMVSLLTAAGVGLLAQPGTDAYLTYAMVLALLAGAVQLIMGVARLGLLTNLLSHPVLSGFSSAAALIIGFSQLKHLLGLDLGRSKYVHEIVVRALRHLGDIEPLTAAVGLGSVVLLVGLRRLWPKLPRALVVVALATFLVWFLDWHEAGVAIVGEVPAGLPGLRVPQVSWAAVERLFPMALTISLVGFMESIAVAKKVAQGHGEEDEIDANQELVGLGVANLGAAAVGGYPVTGGFSRTAVNDQAGARTGIAAVVTAVVIGLTLLFFTSLFYYLPKAVLAAIIMTAVAGLVDLAEVKHLWRVKRDDLALLVVTFVATLALGIEEGILVGVGASVAWFVFRTTRPHAAVLGRLPQTTSYRNLKRHPEAVTIPGVLVVRIDSQFYFGNVTFLKDTLRSLEQAMDEALRAVVIDASSINQLDSSADTALHQIADDYAERGVGLYFAKTKGPVLDVMHASGLYDKIGERQFTFRVHEAIELAVDDHLGGGRPRDYEHTPQSSVS